MIGRKLHDLKIKNEDENEKQILYVSCYICIIQYIFTRA